ncbi:MAG: tRNA lysidine(34) synthetase TilS [Deltaproteobacteria bacterium]|nr:tRNA lysidine(34) synthetase TilS [Deltaproteobacteria bacterium]
MNHALDHIVRKVRKTIHRFGMIDPGDRVIVAVSGGPDSICLLHILNRLKAELDIYLVVAHYDHGLRPHSDEVETKMVREFAESLSLSFETEKSTSLLQSSGGSLEERARDERYAYLEGLRERLGAQKIALGHNLDDQAETVIMRLLRGSGPSGLGGIPPVRDGKIIRPLIEIRRKEIEAYLESLQLPYVVDQSNYDTRFLRNRIRLEIMPALLQIQPKLLEHLARTAEILRADNQYLVDQAGEWIKEEASFKPNGDIVIPVDPFLALPRPIRQRVLRDILKLLKESLRRISSTHIQSIEELARGERPQGILNLPKSITVERSYDRLVFSTTYRSRRPDFHYLLDRPGRYHIKEIDRTLVLEELEGLPESGLASSPLAAYLDAGKIEYPLTVRNLKPGDRFIPLGMKGHKKVKDFFIDLKVPIEARYRTPILFSGGVPVWICGYRIDERFKITPTTRKILKARISALKQTK